MGGCAHVELNRGCVGILVKLEKEEYSANLAAVFLRLVG